jgi:hypothetical protein
MASICCSPPDRVPASCPGPFLQARQQAVDAVEVGGDFGAVVAQ